MPFLFNPCQPCCTPPTPPVTPCFECQANTTPRQWQVTASGFGNGTGMSICTNFNGTFVLDPLFPLWTGTSCRWQYLGPGGAWAIDLLFFRDTGGNLFLQVQFGIPSSFCFMSYQISHGTLDFFDCRQTFSVPFFAQGSIFCFCSPFPGHVILTPIP